jgi:tripartite-type tricarboxylate transporter receptor subunit TctC
MRIMNQIGRLLLLLLVCSCTAANAQYPTKPIRLMVPFPPGGPADVLSRVVAKRLSDQMGQQMLIENRAGAGGTSAMEIVAKSPADGYTLGLGSNSVFSIAPQLYTKLSYDPFKSFMPISLVARSASVIVINASVPANNLKELIAVLKAKPGAYNYGSNGNGTIPHLAGLLFQRNSGTQLVHVPYKGVAPMTTDLIAGQVQLAFIVSAGLDQHVKAGKLKALAVASSSRLPQLPDVPTTAQAGMPGLESYTWFGIAAPAATPQQVIQRLNGEIRKAVAAREVADVLVAQGFDPEATTPEQFAQYIAQEAERWGPVVKAANMKVD